MTDPNAYVDLIGKYLAGEITPGEKSELMAWVQQTPANRQFFEEMEQLWRISAQYDPQPELDAEPAWERLQEKLPVTGNQLPETRNRKPETRYRILLRIAAVLLPAVLALWWWQTDRNAAQTLVSVQTQAGERREVQLPDGSMVQLNQLSDLSFQENDSARYVTLSGEAFFDVKHLNGKPFVILSGDARTTVLGTSFNVRAYPQEKQVEVSVVSGKVRVEDRKAPEQKAVLQAGQAATLDQSAHRIALDEDLAANAAAWKNRRLRFSETPVSEVTAILERYFDVHILIEDANVGRCRFSGEYNDPKIEDVLRALAFAVDMQLEEKDTVYTIRGEGCPR